MNLHHSFLISHVTVIILCGGGKLGQNSYGNETNEMHALTLYIVQHVTTTNCFNKKIINTATYLFGIYPIQFNGLPPPSQ